jgi:hypothetical protein
MECREQLLQTIDGLAGMTLKLSKKEEIKQHANSSHNA